MALAIWFKDPETGQPAEVQHVHKGKCDHDLAERNGEISEGTAELTTDLIHLLHNCGAPVKKLYEHDKQFEISDFPGFA